MDEEYPEWGNEVWTDICSERRLKRQFQGAGVHPWIVERWNGLARGIFFRLASDGHLSGKQSALEFQWRLRARIPGVDIRLINLLPAPTRRTSVGGMTRAGICLPRILRYRDSLRSNGNSA